MDRPLIPQFVDDLTSYWNDPKSAKYFIVNDGPSEFHDFYEGWIYSRSSPKSMFRILAIFLSDCEHSFWNRRQLLNEHGAKSVQTEWDYDEWPGGAHPISEQEANSIIARWKEINKEIWKKNKNPLDV